MGTSTDSSTLHLRTATTADAPCVLGFMRLFYASFGYPFDETAARGALLPLIADGSTFGRAWILEAGGCEIGYLVVGFGYSLEHRGRDAFVDEVWVDPAWRGRGFAGRALAHAERECVTLGVHALHLEVERSNSSAHALYRRLGFEGNDRVMMTKRIT